MRRRSSINLDSHDEHAISHEFKHISIGDKRLTVRLMKTAATLQSKPGKSIPEACDSWAETKAIYRMLSNKKLSRDAIFQSHRLQTIERIKGHEIILSVQDTTTLDYSTHPNTKGLGMVTTSKKVLGLLMHSSLAVSTDGIPLGLLALNIWTRDPAEYGKKHLRKELPIHEKESYRWLETMEQSSTDLPPGVKLVTVADREADIYELFLKAEREGRHLLIRAAQDRCVDGEYKKLYTQVSNAPVVGDYLVKVPRKTGLNTPPRVARIEVRVSQVKLMPPKNGQETSAVSLFAIFAREITPCQGEKPIDWLLLTTLSVQTTREAMEKIEWYGHRWKIERFHFVLKSGCRIEELQLETRERLENAIALYSVVAWKLTWIIYQSRETPMAPASLVLSDREWQVAYCLVTGKPKPPKKPPTLEESVVLIARLGGFLARKHDGQPGVKVLWRGLRRLHDIVDALQILQPLHFGTDVGNA